jgi:hypothetical protein
MSGAWPEHLGVSANRVLEPAFEVDAAFLGDLEARLGLQHVDRDARPPLDPFVLEVELDLDGVLVRLRQLDEALLAQHVDVCGDTLEQRVLPGALGREAGDQRIDARRLGARRGDEPVEQVLG